MEFQCIELTLFRSLSCANANTTRYGILTFVGVAGILPETGNQLSKRMLLLFSFPSEFPDNETYTQVCRFA